MGSASIMSDRTIIERTTTPVAKLPYAELLFGKSFTDHMLEIDWTAKDGWSDPVISPLKPIKIDPAAQALHYSFECFEGMKAYKDADGNTRLFRPEMNTARLQRSMHKVHLPTYDQKEFIKCLVKLLKVDDEWIPRAEGYSLYLRPTAISTCPNLNIAKPESCKLFVICSPVGPYYPEGFKPVKLYADNKYVRAWPGGTGDTKLAGNYAPTILPQQEAGKKGYTQVLWLYGEKKQVTEVREIFMM
jgi:branched-chain amino acid aminotransferase